MTYASFEDTHIISSHYDPLDARTWPYYPIEMPLNTEGQGPASIAEAHSITYEVWDHFCNSYGSHKYLPDAINQALQLTQALLNEEMSDDTIVKYQHRSSGETVSLTQTQAARFFDNRNPSEWRKLDD